MVCYHPKQAFEAQTRNPETGKYRTTFVLANARRHPLTGALIERRVPCGQCIGCRVDKSIDWASRCVHEAQMHEDNSFITLTFRQEDLPASGSISKRDIQLFLKRLRKLIQPNKIRYYAVGEYGEKLSRPHYHAIIFGWDFPDKVFWKNSPAGGKLYTSETLEKAWPYGFCSVGDVTHESAAYCARYANKKIYGKKSDSYYEGKEKEFALMSLKPGIGEKWYEKYKDDLYPSDECVVRGKVKRVPRFYDRMLENENPEFLEQIKEKRKYKASLREHDNTKERRLVKEECQTRRIERLIRSVESG